MYRSFVVSLRIVAENVVTDRHTHTQTDKYRNPRCACTPRVNNFATIMSLIQDYPSIYQVREKLIENDIITIFAVAKDVVVNRTSTGNIAYRVSEEVQKIVYIMNINWKCVL